MQLTHLSLFSGIGGLDLAAERAGFRTVGQCEWADYPHAVLTKHWPDVPKWRDIRTLTGGSFYERTGLRTVDVVSGGFPCQPFSVAGKRRGADDDRYLWPEMLRVIEEIRPTWVVGENVAGIVSMALDTVLSDLEALGYACQAFVIPACAVDAPHRRDRCAIVGYTKHDGLSAAAVAGGTTAAGRDEPQGKDTPCESSGTGLRGYGEDVADTEGERCGKARGRFARTTQRSSWGGETLADTQGQRCKRYNEFTTEQNFGSGERQLGAACGPPVADTYSGTMRDDVNDRRPPDREVYASGNTGLSCRKKPNVRDSASWGLQIAEQESGGEKRICESAAEQPFASNAMWWPIESDVGRVAHGVPHRVDRLRCLGNAVVPPQFYPIFRVIAYIERIKQCNTDLSNT